MRGWGSRRRHTVSRHIITLWKEDKCQQFIEAILLRESSCLSMVGTQIRLNGRICKIWVMTEFGTVVRLAGNWIFKIKPPDLSVQGSNLQQNQLLSFTGYRPNCQESHLC